MIKYTQRATLSSLQKKKFDLKIISHKIVQKKKKDERRSDTHVED